MRYRFLFAIAALSLPVAAPAGDAPAGDRPTKDDFADLSRLIKQVVIKQVPRTHEEFINWNNSIPIPERMRFPNLPRTYLKVGDHRELAHGAWKRIKVKLEDPERDLKIKVKEFRKLDQGYRVVIDAETLLRCDGQWDQWLRGLSILKVEGQADARIASTIVSDVDVSINFNKFPPAIKVEPKIVDLTLDLKDFNLNRLGGTVQGEKLRQLANDLMRDTLRDLLKAAEPQVKDYANEAIAQSLEKNKGRLSAGELLRAVPKEKLEKEEKK